MSVPRAGEAGLLPGVDPKKVSVEEFFMDLHNFKNMFVVSRDGLPWWLSGKESAC